MLEKEIIDFEDIRVKRSAGGGTRTPMPHGARS